MEVDEKAVPRAFEGLAGPALRAFFRIADLWSMTDEEQMSTLGISTFATLRNWREGDPERLSRETVTRASYVLGIYHAINILLPEQALANAWMRWPNKAAVFEGRSAMELVASGDVADLAIVRRYLDAQLNT